MISVLALIKCIHILSYHDRSSFNFGNQLLKDLPVFDASTIGIIFYDAVYLENIFDHNLKGMRFPLITIFGSTYIALVKCSHFKKNVAKHFGINKP